MDQTFMGRLDRGGWSWYRLFGGWNVKGNAPSRLAAVALLVGFVGAACSQNNPGTPGPSSGPAFTYVSYKQAACGQDTCVSLRVRNEGNEGGPGTCKLHDDAGGSNPGSSVQLPIVEPGKSIEVTLRWSGRAPKSLAVLCEPGLRS